MSPSLALQAGIRARLIADPAVIEAVPAADITDKHGRVARFPSVTFGEFREYVLAPMKRDSTRVSLDLHVWTDTPGTRDAKRLTDTLRRALRDGPWKAEGHIVMDLAFSGARYLPDPENPDITHGVISFDAFMLEEPDPSEVTPPPASGDGECGCDADFDPGDLTLVFNNRLI